MLNKNKVEELYLKGWSYSSIASELESNYETVRKCIQRNFRSFRSSNTAEKLRRKEVDRITRHEANQYMSDKDFVKRNRSIYRTEKDGDIVVKNEFEKILSFDVPRRLKNEDRCVI